MTEHELALWCVQQESSDLDRFILDAAADLGLVRACECCELYYKAAEVRSYLGVNLCDECKENSEAWDNTLTDLCKWLDKERR